MSDPASQLKSTDPAPRHRLNERVVLAVFLVALGAAALIYWQSDLRPRTPPGNHEISEEIRGAIALQKQGDLEPAIIILERYAMQGYPQAMFHTGRAYARGWGVKPDLEKARHYFLLAVQYKFPGRGQTAYEIGRLFQRSSGPDCDTIAVGWFEKALQWGFVKAALQLSMHYETGLGVEPDMNVAIRHYERASRAGFARAKLNYAAFLLSERAGDARDPERAATLIDQAIASLERKALRGSASAAKQLGRLYRDGIILDDQQQTHRWFLHAALLGSSGAMHDLARLLLAQKDRSDLHPEALDWLRKAASLGHGGAQTSLGRYHLKSSYGLDRPGAIAWFQQGVEAGHSGAMKELARLYADGDMVPEDRDEAIRLATLGAQTGHKGSITLLNELSPEQTENPQHSAQKSAGSMANAGSMTKPE